MPEAVAVSMLVVVLAWAVIRPRGLSEAVIAVPAAVVVLAVGALSARDALDEVRQLAPVVIFLAAVLTISELCDRDGLFRYAGAWLGARSRGDPARLLTLVFALAAAVTAVLSLDATVVLLTPVVFATASRIGVRARPHSYACAHLANAGSLFLPVSNLTNLLAMAAAGLSFVRFAAVMALPSLVVIAVEYVAFRRAFAGELSLPASAPRGADRMPPLPRFSAAVLASTLAGFVMASFADVPPAWVAVAGAAAMAVRAAWRGDVDARRALALVNPGFLAFVLALGVVVTAVVRGGVGDALGAVVPSGTGVVSLLAWAALAAVLANLVNNLPAALALLPFAAPAGTGPVLAMLIGTNVGPNLTYVGSLATLLWRRIMRAHRHDVPLPEFTRLGLLTTPAAIVAGVLALWASLEVFT